MNIAILTPGTGSYYCGACMRDNALAKSLHAAGHEVSLLPMYLPLQLDESQHPTPDNPIFFGGINVFLQQKLPFFRSVPRWLHKLLNHSGLLRSAAKRSHMTSAREHGAMALAMLEIEDSPFGRELDHLIDWLAREKPDILVLGTALQAGIIRELKKRVGCRIMCSFQGEDSFLDGLPEPFKTDCWRALRERLPEADLLVAPSRFYADLMRERLDLPAQKIEVLPNGIATSKMDRELQLAPEPKRSGSPPVIGYLARMIPEKGLHHLVEAFIHLRKDLGHPDARLHIAGAATAADEQHVAKAKTLLSTAGLTSEVKWSPNIELKEKQRLLSSFSLFSVPATYPEAFGLYTIEALAAGVPLVLPRSSSFPEIVERSQAGHLVDPGDPAALAQAWHELLADPARLDRLRKNALQSAREFYSVETMRDRFLALAEPLTARTS